MGVMSEDRRLPPELWLEVLDCLLPALDLAGLVLIRGVNHLFFDYVESRFSCWLGSQPVGVPLPPVEGLRSPAVRFLADHVDGE